MPEGPRLPESFDRNPHTLPHGDWEWHGGGWWLEIGASQVEEMAAKMTSAGSRLITATLIRHKGEAAEQRVAYYWDYQGQVFTFLAATDGGRVPSIAAICPAADWAEREIHDYYAVEFTGRELEPLMLRPDDQPGIFRRHIGCDPAQATGAGNPEDEA